MTDYWCHCSWYETSIWNPAFTGHPAFIGDPAFIWTFDKYPPAFNRDPAFIGDPAFIRSFTVHHATNIVKAWKKNKQVNCTTCSNYSKLSYPSCVSFSCDLTSQMPWLFPHLTVMVQPLISSTFLHFIISHVRLRDFLKLSVLPEPRSRLIILLFLIFLWVLWRSGLRLFVGCMVKRLEVATVLLVRSGFDTANFLVPVSSLRKLISFISNSPPTQKTIGLSGQAVSDWWMQRQDSRSQRGSVTTVRKWAESSINHRVELLTCWHRQLITTA